jgi:hypothetical protein
MVLGGCKLDREQIAAIELAAIDPEHVDLVLGIGRPHVSARRVT